MCAWNRRKKIGENDVRRTPEPVLAASLRQQCCELSRKGIFFSRPSLLFFSFTNFAFDGSTWKQLKCVTNFSRPIIIVYIELKRVGKGNYYNRVFISTPPTLSRASCWTTLNKQFWLQLLMAGITFNLCVTSLNSSDDNRRCGDYRITEETRFELSMRWLQTFNGI